MSSITDNLLFQADTTKKYDIPVGHLDYDYIRNCSDTKELEKILKILRSGDEGFYPDMETVCEERIEKLNPKSRVLRKELPLTRPGELAKDEWQQIDSDLKDWELEMKTTESAKKKILDDFDDPGLPPIRSGFINGHANQEPQAETKNKRVTPRDYKEWDKFDIDKELDQVDKQEEKKGGKKSKPPQIDTNINTSGMTDEEKMMKAGREKDKGNEAFRAGDYEESISYYTRSIKLHSTAASYNNRAIAHLKTSHWTNAANDCNMVLDIEPDNIKALLRRGTAYKGMKEFSKSIQDYENVLQLEPENKRAQDLISELKEEENKYEEEKKRRKEKGRRMVIEEVDEESEDEIVVDKKSDKKEKNPEKIQVVNGHIEEKEKKIEKKDVKNHVEENIKSETKISQDNLENVVKENESKKNAKTKDKKEVKNNKGRKEERKNEDKNIWNEEEIIEEVSHSSESIQSETSDKHSKNNQEGSKLQSESRLGFSQSSKDSTISLADNSEKQSKSDMGRTKDNTDLESSDIEKNKKLESENSVKMETSSAISDKPVLIQGPLSSQVAAFRESGNNLFRRGQYGEAVQKYTSAIDKIGKEKTDQRVNLSLLYSNRAASYLKTGDCPHAINDCTTALELVPHSIKPLLRRANAYEMLERYRPAYADFKHVLSIDSSVDMALQGSSRCQKHLIEVDGSKWREKLPRVPSVKSWEIPEIVDSTGQAVNSSPAPSQPTTSTVTSSSQPIKSSVPSSSSSPKDTSEKRTESPEQKFDLMKSEGNSHVQKGQYQEAVPCYTSCIEILPDKAVSYTNRSLCYLKLNKPEEAEADCTKALTLEKDNVKAMFRRAQARKMLKKNKESLEDLNHLLKVDSKNTAAKKEMEVVKGLWREELNTIKKQMEKPVDNKPRKRIVIKETDSDEEEEKEVPLPSHKDQPKTVNKKVSKTESKPTAKQSDTEPKVTSQQPIKQEKTTPPSKQPQKTTKSANSESQKDQKKTKVNPSQTSKSSASSIKPTSFGLPQTVPKLEKATPYEFLSAWNALKQSTDVQPYADLLRQIPPADLPKVISNKLDGGMLSKITKCVAEKYTSPDDLTTGYQILSNVSKVPRFETIAMFMSKPEKKGIETVLNKVESLGGVASKEEINQLRKKYSL